MEYSYKRGWWETKDHRKIKIEDMKTSHIENTIKYLKKHTGFYDYDDSEAFYNYDNNSYLVDNKIKELQYELDKRKEK